MDRLLTQLLWNLVAAAPWLLALGLGAGLLAMSPFGKLVTRLMQDRLRADDLLQANTSELSEVTRTLEMMTERLDATERALSLLAQREAATPALPRPTPSRGDQ